MRQREEAAERRNRKREFLKAELQDDASYVGRDYGAGMAPRVSTFLHSFVTLFRRKEESLPADPSTLDKCPPEVKGQVLHHLPYEKIVQLMSVSKSWKSLIQSAGFLDTLSLRENPRLTACYFYIHNGIWQWAGFDPNWRASNLGQSLGNQGKWRKLPPLTFLPPNCEPDPELFKQFLFSARNGLVCMNFSKSPHEERLIIFNPLTEQWKELPPLLHRRNPVFMHLFADPTTKSYRILVAGSSAAGDESLSRITELYDSRTGRWERKGDFPGPAFSLNEYQSGVYQNGNIFCIGFVELGEVTAKGILGFNLEEGSWSAKWTERALPISTILQLVENHGELFLFSERDNGPLIEHWVDRVSWVSASTEGGLDGERAERRVFHLVNIWKKSKGVGRSLEVYPEYALVSFGESQLCVFNTVDHSGDVFEVEAPEKCEALPALPEGFRGELGLFSLNPISFAMEPRFDIKV